MKRLLRILRIWVTPVHEMLNNEKSNFTCTRTAVNYWFYQALAGISLTLEQYVWSAVCTYELKSKPAHKGPPDFRIHRIIINVNLLFICLSVKFYIFRQGSYRTIHWNTPSFFKKEYMKTLNHWFALGLKGSLQNDQHFFLTKVTDGRADLISMFSCHIVDDT